MKTQVEGTSSEGLVRAIGRWSIAALTVNCVIGSGVFRLPADLAGLLGRASILAIVLSAGAVGVIMACFSEVASRFAYTGGPYVYAQESFGRFMRLHQLGLELPQELFAFLLKDSAIGNWVWRTLQGLRQQLRRDRRDALVMLASGAHVKIGWIVQMAFGTWQPVSRCLSRGIFLHRGRHAPRTEIFRQCGLNARCAIALLRSR